MSSISRTQAIAVLAAAVSAGGAIGIGSTFFPTGGAGVEAAARRIGAAGGIVRLRAPQAGDEWGGCNAARAAGTAPIYRGEPGYRSDMDGDDDGIACEPRPDLPEEY